ncbi:MAG: class I SAM-dependent methyltransferase [Anaerolineae bacterium]|nr:class I SAM-dependent methyltransferase [Anaerolineae bacterium]
MSAQHRGLDAAFLQYIGYDTELQKVHQRFYVPFFADCQRVVDLGCGYGDFVELLVEQGIGAIGVDADSVACQAAQARDLVVVNQDVFEYLSGLPAESVDGVFAAHLVEHLAFEQVLELIRSAYRVLKPGGVIVLATPDPRSLYAHLDMFYLHFGHVTFYHPRLLCFFLEYAGLDRPEFGNNTSQVQIKSPLFGVDWRQSVRAGSLPLWKDTLFRRWLRAVRMAIARIFLNPYLDLIDANFRRVQVMLERVDYPFECYAKAVKPQSCAQEERL